MRILILGGTVFVGRALTDAALARGHEVAHFNRGKTAAPDPRVTTLLGDRTRLDDPELRMSLASREWDAVIDTSGYLPQVVRQSVEALRDRTRLYVFVSTISVYRGYPQPRYTEDAEVSPAPDPLPEAPQAELYGPLKAACEAVVREVMGERALVVRPGLIVGPNDPTDRFTYWPWRIAQGGEVLAPGRPSRQVQFIDARDLASWMVLLCERGVTGTLQATGPAEVLSMETLLEACRVVVNRTAALRWREDAFLLEQKVGPWREMPLWLPESDVENRGLMTADIGRALAAGLAFRAIEDTIADTLAWAEARPKDHAWKAGLDRQREEQLLAAARGN